MDAFGTGALGIDPRRRVTGISGWQRYAETGSAIVETRESYERQGGPWFAFGSILLSAAPRERWRVCGEL
jgi:hypothetical protein